MVNFNVEQGTEIIGNNQIGMSAVIASGGTYQVGTGYWGFIDNSKQAVSLTLQGGNFVEYGLLAGTTSQPFNNGLVVNSGASTASAVNNSGAGTLVSFNAAGSRAVGGTVNFVLPSGVQSAVNGFTTVNLNTNGILGGYATVGGTDWATNATNLSGGNIIGLSSSAINGYSTDLYGTALNTNVVAGGAGASTNSLRFGTAAANTVTFTGTNTINSGGILVTPTVGANLTDITGGTLEGAAGADLVVIQNNTSGGLQIDSIIADNAAATGLTKSGAGLLTLTGANTYTGGTFLNGGVLNTTAGGINSSSATNGIAFNGGTLQAAGAITTAKTVAIGPNGGTIDTNGSTVTLTGIVSGTPGSNNGGSAIGAGAFGGFNSSGVYSFTKNGTGTLALQGANTFGGPLVINNGTVQDGNASVSAVGTGYVTFGSANGTTPTLDLDGHSPTVAGLIGTGTNGIVTSSVAGAVTLTLDGVSSQTYAGVIQNGTGTVGLTVALNNLTERQILTGANTYSGATTVSGGTLALANTTARALTATSSIAVNTGGTLLFSQPNQVNTVAPITLGTVAPTTGTLSFAAGASQGTAATVTGGTVSGSMTTGGTVTGTTTAGLGALTLNSNSTLTFGGANATLVFNTFSDPSSKVLTVAGYANAGVLTPGNSGMAGDDRLIFSGNQSGNLADFDFGYGAGVNVGEVALGGNFYEITAVPEPATWMAGFACLGVVGWQFRGWRKSRRDSRTLA